MTLIADVVTASDVKQIQFDIFDENQDEYLRAGPSGMRTGDDIRHQIVNVSESSIRQILRAVVIDEESAVRDAWAHFMALLAGRHLFPDANHRTAMTTFELAVERRFAVRVGLPADVSRAMVVESKAMRDRAKLARGSYYTVAELADPAHEYRALFARYAKHLKTAPAPHDA